MSEALNGRCAVVTGGANGIGAATVRALIAEGVNVSFCDVDQEAGECLAAECGAEFRLVDVTDANALESWYCAVDERYDGVDIVVNNVGISEFVPLTEISVEQFDRVIATNLRPAFILSRLFARMHNPNSGYGRIVNIASTRHQQSEPSSEAYAAAKGGVISLTHAVAISLSTHVNTTVNSISPGWIDTGHYEITDADNAFHPSGRVGVTDDVTSLITYLCDPRSGFINAQDHIVDGGVSRQMKYE